MAKKTHANTGNQFASKTTDAKLTGSVIHTAAPDGLLGAIKIHVSPSAISPWIREAIYRRLESEKFDPKPLLKWRASEKQTTPKQ